MEALIQELARKDKQLEATTQELESLKYKYEILASKHAVVTSDPDFKWLWEKVGLGFTQRHLTHPLH
jgi:hypothetical protein